MIGAWEPGKHGNVPCITADATRTTGAHVLFLGDMHLDHPRTDRAALKHVLDEAVAKNAAIVLLGDQFDVMQGRQDRRSAKSALSARYAGRDDYLTAVLEDVTAYLLPYAGHVWLVLDGNHEASILKYNEVSLTRLLVHNLNAAGGSAVAVGYRTYAALKVRLGGAVAPHLIPFYATHGSGGSSPVTGGVISSQRRAVHYPDAAFVMSGHLHQEFYKPFVQHRLSARGRAYSVKQRHYQVSAWKQGYSAGPDYESERGLPPTVASGWWLEVLRARGATSVPPYRLRFTEAD